MPRGGTVFAKQQAALNPDAGGITGLFSEGADYFSDGISNVLDFGSELISDGSQALQDVLKGVASYKLFDAQLDAEEARLRGNSQDYNPAPATGAGFGGGGGALFSGDTGKYLMIGGAVLAAVFLLPKLLR